MHVWCLWVNISLKCVCRALHGDQQREHTSNTSHLDLEAVGSVVSCDLNKTKS